MRAMTRNPSGSQWPDGVDVVLGDFGDADSLDRAVDGIESAFLLTAPGGQVPDHDRALVKAASAAGLRKLVKLSAIGTTDDPADGLPGSWHSAGEQAVRESGLAWTLLRPAGFASNSLRWLAAIRAGEPVSNLTGDGMQGVVDPRDVAAVAVEALLSGDHEGRTYTLTGPELLSVPDQAAQLAAELGRKVRVVDVPLEVGREQMLAAGMDVSVVDVAIRGAALLRTGGAATLTADVERVLGRPAGTFRAWAREHRDSFN